jgi:signal transduction histidine kinase
LISDAENLDHNNIERLHEIQQTAVRLTRLSNTLLLISRVENRQFEMDDEINVLEVIEQVLKELQDFIEIKGLTIEKYLNQKFVFKGNKELIHSAIYNMIQNAIKYTPEGSKIHLSLSEKSSGKTEFSVSDEGPGIPEELINKVFDRFRKGEKLSDHGNSSPGLGLSIVKSICELHSLDYKAENNPDQGVTFSILF